MRLVHCWCCGAQSHEGNLSCLVCGSTEIEEMDAEDLPVEQENAFNQLEEEV